MNKQRLIEYFEFAKTHNYEYVAVQIKMKDCKKPEIIINSKENFDFKLNYYLNAYNDKLELNHCTDIKIMNICIGNTLNDIEKMLK